MKKLWQDINNFVALPVIAILIALLVWGYNQYIEKQEEKKEVLKAKLEKFYYPLSNISSMSLRAWQEFRKEYGTNRQAYFSDSFVIMGENEQTIHFAKCYNYQKPKVFYNVKKIESILTHDGRIQRIETPIKKLERCQILEKN